MECRELMDCCAQGFLPLVGMSLRDEGLMRVVMRLEQVPADQCLMPTVNPQFDKGEGKKIADARRCGSKQALGPQWTVPAAKYRRCA